MEARGVGFSEPVIQDRDANGNLIQKAAQANRRVVIELLS
jgi:outer membrane protein OmpA-like peptidoglycan-associated protein